MQNQLIKINSTNLQIKEYQGKRVCTLKDIDTVHAKTNEVANRNFNRNRKHFIEGEDYFRTDCREAKSEFNITAPNGLTLITESGYLMLVKSFTDDLAWDVQRQLVNNYFRKPEPKVPTVQMPPVKTQLQILEEEYLEALKNTDQCKDLKEFNYKMHLEYGQKYRKALELENEWKGAVSYYKAEIQKIKDRQLRDLCLEASKKFPVSI